MKILITGGAGYIGSVATLVLREAGHEVTVLDNFSHGNRDAIPDDVRLLEGSLAEFEALVEPGEFDAVVHLAAFMAAGESMQKPELYWQNNVGGSLALLNGMRKVGIKKLVFASTAATYGDPESIPILETAPCRPTNTYGMTKLAIDMAITSEAWAHELSAASLRFFNVAGAYKDRGERHPIETHIIPLLLEFAAGKRKEFTLYGTDYPTEDGTCIRDYIHVYDLALAIQKSLEVVKPGAHSIYNLANGRGFSNRQVIEAVEQVIGRKLTIKTGPRRGGDPAVLVASSQKAKDELDWEPTRPELQTMIQDAWQFYQLLNRH